MALPYGAFEPDPRRSRTLTRTLTIALAIAAAGCTVGERPECCAEPTPAPPPPTLPAPAADRPERPSATLPDVRIGVILPRSGAAYLQRYADLLLEGMRLAATEYDGTVDLVVLDDGGLPFQDSALVVQAIEREAVAIVGPMLSGGVATAAVARQGRTPVLLSPTASVLPDGLDNVYTLNAVDLRGPRALAEYAVRGEHLTAAVLYAGEDAASRQAWAFRQAFEDLGGRVAVMAPYDSGTTTFAQPIRRIAEARPAVVYIATSPQDVAVIAPQLSYYGVRDALLMGNESWLDPEVLRTVSTRFTDGVIASTSTPGQPGLAAAPEFVRLYEETYRRALDNPFPALGYDAVRLLLRATRDLEGALTPARLAESLSGIRAFAGATGVLSVEAGALTRAPFLHRVRDGAATVAPSPESLRAPTETAPPGAGPSGAASPPYDRSQE